MIPSKCNRAGEPRRWLVGQDCGSQTTETPLSPGLPVTIVNRELRLKGPCSGRFQLSGGWPRRQSLARPEESCGRFSRQSGGRCGSRGRSGLAAAPAQRRRRDAQYPSGNRAGTHRAGRPRPRPMEDCQTARPRCWVALAHANAVVATNARESRHRWLDQAPRVRALVQPGVENDNGGSGAGYFYPKTITVDGDKHFPGISLPLGAARS